MINSKKLCFTCAKLTDTPYPCDYGCKRIYCSEECADQIDVDPIEGSGIYWCPACKKDFEAKMELRKQDHTDGSSTHLPPVDRELSQSDIEQQAQQLADKLGKPSFQEVIMAYDNKEYYGKIEELAIGRLKHLCKAIKTSDKSKGEWMTDTLNRLGVADIDLPMICRPPSNNPEQNNHPGGYPKNNPAFDELKKKVLEKGKENAERAKKFLERLRKNNE